MHILDSKSVIQILKRTFRVVSDTHLRNAERITYLVYHMLLDTNKLSRKDIHQICMMALLHHIGIFKTEEFDHALDTKDDWSHVIYGYLFVRLWVPSCSYANIVLYHHMSYEVLERLQVEHRTYANMVLLADHIVDCLHQEKNLDASFFDGLVDIDPSLIVLFRKANQDGAIVRHLLENGDILLTEVFEGLLLSSDEINQYLNLIAYFIDFRSEFTVSHTMMVVELAVELARAMKLTETEIEELRIGALLHDLGKIATPVGILEKPGRLNADEIKTMQQHVVITREILEGCIADEICQVAARHHEKLNGSGYPLGLFEKDLSIAEKIMAVADIASALFGQRSYKESFPKEQIVSILESMSAKEEISKEIVGMLIDRYDRIFYEVNQNSNIMMQEYVNIKRDFIELSEAYYRTLLEEEECSTIN